MTGLNVPRALATVLLGGLLCGIAVAESPENGRGGRGTPTLVFESRAPGQTGGGNGISDTIFPGHMFRVTERTEITELGAGNLSGADGESIFISLYRTTTPATPPDIVNDTDLIEAELVTIPTGGAADVTGTVNAIVEPGWYAIVAGSGRHGATAGTFAATLVNTGTTTTPNSYGPYVLNSTTGGLSLQASTFRVFARGETLPPAPPDDTRFLHETAGPAAWQTSSAYGVDDEQFWGTRFEITQTTRVGEVGGWMRLGDGQIFAAVVELDGPADDPPPADSPAFIDDVVDTVLIDAASAQDAYTGDFGNLELGPGHYALVFGSGLFDASGSAGLLAIDDQIVHPGALAWVGGSWFDAGGPEFRLWLEGTVDPIAVVPDDVDFGTAVIGYPEAAGVTIDHRAGGAIEITDITLVGTDPGQFQLDADVADCLGVLAADTACTFTLRYAPDAAAGHAAALQVTAADATPDTYAINLAGTAIEGTPMLQFTPVSLDFGSVEYGTTSAALTAGLENVGNGPSEGLAFTLDDADYAYDATDCGASLEPAAGCEIDVTFTPSDAGADIAELSATDSDGSLALLDLAGTGVEVPGLLAAPEWVAFTDTEIGATVTSSAVMLQNPGGGSLELAPLALAGPHAADFQLTAGGDGCSGASLDGGSFCEFTVDFSPSAAGVRRAWLVVDSNAPDAPHRFAVTGTHDVIFHDGFEDGPLLPD